MTTEQALKVKTMLWSEDEGMVQLGMTLVMSLMDGYDDFMMVSKQTLGDEGVAESRIIPPKLRKQIKWKYKNFLRKQLKKKKHAKE